VNARPDRYEYGPPVAAVEAVAGRFAGADFDGMTDSTTYNSELLCAADGSIREVRYGIHFVFVDRDTPQAIFDATVSLLAQGWNADQWNAMQPWDRERIARPGISAITTNPNESPESAAARAVAHIFRRAA